MQVTPAQPDRQSVLALPAGSVPRAKGELASTSSGRIGAAAVSEEERAERAQTNPYPLNMALLEHGRERFDIYCAPCHGFAGNGEGVVAQRGFPHPPTYHQARLRAAPDRYFYDVMTNGYGIMTWFRLPLFVWAIYATSVILLLATPVLAMTLVLVAIERLLRVGIFDPALGGDPLLSQHLFWFYSHPAVYIMGTEFCGCGTWKCRKNSYMGSSGLRPKSGACADVFMLPITLMFTTAGPFCSTSFEKSGSAAALGATVSTCSVRACAICGG